MKTYGFGLIGCGRISKNHLEAICRLPQASLEAVSDTKSEVLECCVKQFSCRGYAEYRQLLQDERVDIVNICTESGFHAKIAIEAMRAGKHVLVEKPMAMSLAEADRMICVSRAMRVKLGVVHQNRFNLPIKKLKKAVEDGRFGKLTHAAATVRWNRNDAYYAQAPWRGTWALDGGCLMNQAIHNIDLLQWMMGPAEKVFAYAATNLRPIEGEDTAMAIVRFRNGAFATIEAATTVYPQNLEETFSIFGTTGTARVGGIAVNRLDVWRFDEEDEAEALATCTQEPPNVYGFGHADIIADMIEAVDADRDPAVSGPEGKKALELILAIYHSVKYRKEIQIPLQEQFTIGLQGEAGWDKSNAG